MIIDFWMIFVFAIVLIIFFMVFSIDRNANEKKVQAEFLNKDVNFMLESFLRAPALGSGIDSSKTIGEIIVEDSTNNNFDNTEKLFESYFSGVNELNGLKVNAIRIEIKGPHNDGTAISKNQRTWRFVRAKFLSFRDGRRDVYIAETYIPGYDQKVYVKLSIVEVILASELKAAQDAEKDKTNG